MGKPPKSQWDFGELFPTEQVRKVLSVSELTGQIRALLERQVGSVWVGGEVTNFRAQSSGHIYFTLKDAVSQIACVLFRGEAIPHRELIADGQKVLLRGDVTVYEARGQYQLIVRSVEMQGVGALQIAFEKLKQKLAAEGLFAPERKRPLPEYPHRIGLVTSPTGAAIRDVLHVVQRRNPGLEIIMVPCRVQGEGAAGEIAEAIRLLNQFTVHSSQSTVQSPTPTQFGVRSSEFGVRSPSEVRSQKSEVRSTQAAIDLILLTRGGGSLEDLWAFNEEIVARAIFESALPVVSAVGHEIDFTISDFVADVRAATPSAAAEIITEGVFASREFVAGAPLLMSRYVRRHVEHGRADVDSLAGRLARCHPRRRLDEWLQRLDDLQVGLGRCARRGVRDGAAAWRTLADRLGRIHPAQFIRQQREALEISRQRLHELAEGRLRTDRLRFETMSGRLRLLGPEQVLSRGYSITMDAASGKVLRDAKKIKAGQRLRTRLKVGEIRSVVEGRGPQS